MIKTKLFYLFFIFQAVGVYAEELENAIAKLVLNYADTVQIGVEVVSLRDGALVYAHNNHHLMTPASNTKIITAAAALHQLGHDYTFVTSVFSSGTCKDGVLMGNLFIQGSGDPSFSTEHLQTLCKRIKESGIHTIKGAICIDVSVFDDKAFARGYLLESTSVTWNNPIGGFMLDMTGPWVSFSTDEMVPLSTLHHNAPSMHIAYDMRSIDYTFSAMGITHTQPTVIGRVPDDASLLLEHRSQPLTQMLRRTMKYSSNVYADCILKKLGTHVYGVQGSWRSGVRALKNFLYDSIGIQKNALVLCDGSGISLFNSVSPHTITQLLVWARAQPFAALFLDLFPVCGGEGNLKKRMHKCNDCVKAKTGTLWGTSALSGYICNKDSVPVYAFSIMCNKFAESDLLDELVIEGKIAPLTDYKVLLEDALCELLVAHAEIEK